MGSEKNIVKAKYMCALAAPHTREILVMRADKEIFHFYLKTQADMLKRTRHKVTLHTNTAWKEPQQRLFVGNESVIIHFFFIRCLQRHHCLASSCLYFISSIICYCLSKNRKTTESTLRAHSSSSVLFELACFFSPLLSSPIFILLLLQTHPSSLKVSLFNAS